MTQADIDSRKVRFAAVFNGGEAPIDGLINYDEQT
jgi:hypothetical protein